MHWFWIGFLGFIAFIWFVQSIDLAVGALSIPALKSVAPLNDADCPSVSILFAARDEAEKLPAALDTFLALDYPKYEVIAVNDRSEDATEIILQNAARKDPRLKVINISSLPCRLAGQTACAAGGVRTFDRRMADFYGCGCPFRTRRAAARDRAGGKKTLGPHAFAVPRQNVLVRRKDCDDVSSGWPSCSASGRGTRAIRNAQLCGDRRVSIDTAQHLRKNGRTSAAGDGSGGRCESRKAGEGGWVLAPGSLRPAPW